jgi:uncharacterized protein YjiK
MNISLRFVSIVLMALFAAACQSEQVPSSESGSFQQWALPDKLREISGLALTDDGRLLAVSDEEAIVYEIDYRNGTLVKAFAIGEPTVRGDFEGIAVLAGKVWIMTSKGWLYSFTEGADGQRVPYERIKTGLGNQCELEGLEADEQSGRLLLVCKESLKKKKGLRVFEWLVDGDPEQEAVEIDLPEDAMADSIGKKQVNPSGAAIDPATGNLIIVAARQHAIFELMRDGTLIDVIMRLDSKRHRQSEGISITADGRLIIADEANKGPARLAIYSQKTTGKTE